MIFSLNLSKKRTLSLFICAFTIFGQYNISYAAADYDPDSFGKFIAFDSLIPYPSKANIRSQYFSDPLIESCARGFSSNKNILNDLTTSLNIPKSTLNKIKRQSLEFYNSNNTVSTKFTRDNFIVAKQIEYITKKYGANPETSAYTLTKNSSNLDALITVNKDKLVNIYLTYASPGCSCTGEASLGPYKAKNGWIHDFSFSAFITTNKLIVVPNNFYSVEEWSLRHFSGAGCTLMQTYFKVNSNEDIVKRFKNEKPLLPVIDNDDENKTPSSSEISEHPELAFSSLYTVALDGDPKSQYELSQHLRVNNISPQGINFLYQAAENGDPEAQYAFAQYLEDMPNTNDSYSFGLFDDEQLRLKEIRRFMSRACNGGVQEACRIQKSAEVNPIDEGKRLYDMAYKAAAKGDYTNAVKYYRQSLDLGVVIANHDLGYAYFTGLGVQKDLFKARAHFEKAAAVGQKMSMYNLALMCARGEGGPKDLDEADKWFSILSKNGVTEATALRGLIALERNDKASGLKYFDDACQQGNELGCELKKKFKKFK